MIVEDGVRITRAILHDHETPTFAIMQSIRLDRGPSGPVHP